MNTKNWVEWFRQASPYINAHRNQVQVLALSGEALKHPNLDNIIHDITLLNSLGVRLVVVYGARPQIDEILGKNALHSSFHKALRITEVAMMPYVLEAYGRLRSELEAKLSMGLINSPMHGAKIKVVSGNFIMAKPLGVNAGVDMGLTGLVRKVDQVAIEQHLSNSSIVVIPALGYSMNGDIFNLGYEELAGEVAASLQANKIIFFGPGNGLTDASGALVSQLNADQALAYPPISDQEVENQLFASARACQAGVERAHLLSYAHDGALLEELFTRDGVGTMVSVDNYDQIRAARPEDLNGILDLIRPLEAQGFLVRRSRERLETELDYFLVDVRDNAVIACAGLYPFPANQAGELSCFAVDHAYRRKGRGDRLLEAVIARAKNQNFSRLFVLTTKTEQWFKERGFEVASLQDLPGNKNYNTDRNAKILVRQLENNTSGPSVFITGLSQDEKKV